jgi:hypothetical protein
MASKSKQAKGQVKAELQMHRCLSTKSWVASTLLGRHNSLALFHLKSNKVLCSDVADIFEAESNPSQTDGKCMGDDLLGAGRL